MLGGCAAGASPREERASLEPKLTPIVLQSAEGWTLRPGPPETDAPHVPTTVVVNPRGESFNIGVTQYPDLLPATLWIVEEKSLKARLLLIRIPPAASGGVEMPVLYIDEHDRPSLAGTIRQRFKFGVPPDDEPGFNPMIVWDGGKQRLHDWLFKDVDHDGTAELVERDVWKDGGTITCFRFTEQKKFVRVRSESVRPADGD
jgi:hypothetical protein